MSEPGRPGVVLDCMVFFQAASRPSGPAARLFNFALAANASYLVTWDKDMLDLMQDEGFRTQYPRLTILTPVALLQALTRPGDQTP